MRPQPRAAGTVAKVCIDGGPETASTARTAQSERTEPLPPTARTARTAGAWVPFAVAGAIYSALSLVVWWHLWAHPTTATTCGCGDGALTLWVLEWPAYALAHGLNPFHSTALFFPRGINMAPNSLGLGTAFAPVTWLFGPVATMNVITTVSPPLSALSMFWLLRRWVTWAPAAFIGGLWYGFSPFALASLALAHPNFGLTVFPPVIVACLDELFNRRRRRPAPVGIVLGLAVVGEFFVSVELLLLMAFFALMVAVPWSLRVLTRRNPEASRTAGDAVRGVGVATISAAVLLAYPLWYFFAGPAHLAGRAWPNSPPGTVANTPAGFVHGVLSPQLTGIMHLWGGYQGPALPLFSYLGFGMLVVLVAGVALWRNDRRLWFFGLLGLIAAVLSLGVGDRYWAPWRLFVRLPVLDNVVPVNVTFVTDLCVAVMLAIIVGHARSASRAWLGHDSRATVLGMAVGALALAPVGAVLWPNVPMTVRTVVVPQWFSTVAPHLPVGAVVLPYPPALGGVQSSMAWLAVEGMPYSIVGGGGPGVVPARAGRERPGFEVLAEAALPLSPPPQSSPANLVAIRDALAGWRVTIVAVPDQPGLPTYDHGRSISYAVGLFTAALGQLPVHQAQAWVWDQVRSPGSVVRISTTDFQACIGSDNRVADPSKVALCVLGSG
jgi:hypothetical protein